MELGSIICLEIETALASVNAMDGRARRFDAEECKAAPAPEQYFRNAVAIEMDDGRMDDRASGTSQKSAALDIELPFKDTVGFEIVEWSKGRAVVEMPLGAHLINRNGGVHGGAIASIVDAACGFAGCWTGDETEKRGATLSLTTNYLATPSVGPLRAVGILRGGGRRIFFASAEVFDGDGELVALGECTFRYRSG